MLKKVAFTMYPVTNLERARNFYEKTLGLMAGNIYPHAHGSWVEYDLPGGGCFAITDMVKNVRPSAEFGGSIAFEVDDLDKLVGDLKKLNVEFVVESLITPNVCRLAVILDSEGNALTLHQLTNR